MDSDNGNNIGDRGAAISDTVVSLGTRTHVMATHTSGEAFPKIYINGVQQPITVANDFSDVNNMANPPCWWFVGSNPWANGCGGAGVPNDGFFDGMVDEVRSSSVNRGDPLSVDG